ncbi:hypothetical protein QEN19_000761 [Hanseniaspora menglaensis]
MDERVIFHTEYGVGISSLHPQTLGVQYLLKQSSNSLSNCQSRDRELIFVSFKDKAIINTYKLQAASLALSTPTSVAANKTGEIPVLQRLTTLEALSNIILVKDTYLIGTAQKPGRTLMYIYDISSGSLVKTISMGHVHYMAIDKIKYMDERGYIVSVSNDGRFALWDIASLVGSEEESETQPAYIFNEHQGVGVKDVSWDNSESVILSCGDDGNVCCYNFVSTVIDDDLKTENEQGKKKTSLIEGTVDRVVLVSKFTLPQAVLQIELDSAARFAVCVLKNGELWEMPLIYQLGKGKIANLHSLTMQGNSNNSQVSLYNCSLKQDLDLSNDSLFNLLRRGIVACRVVAKGCKSIKLSMDSSSIIMGRKKLGQSCLIVDLNTSQVIKDVGTPLGLNVRAENSEGIIVDDVWTCRLNGSTNKSEFITLPNLGKICEDNHMINVLNSDVINYSKNILIEDFDKYITENVRNVAHALQKASFDENDQNTKSAFETSQVFTARTDNTSAISNISIKDKEIEDLKQQVARLSKAYADLKEMV